MPEMTLTAATNINLTAADEAGLTNRKLEATNWKGFGINL